MYHNLDRLGEDSSGLLTPTLAQKPLSVGVACLQPLLWLPQEQVIGGLGYGGRDIGTPDTFSWSLPKAAQALPLPGCVQPVLPIARSSRLMFCSSSATTGQCEQPILNLALSTKGKRA